MEKRDYLFLYENENNVPNGDPFTKQQRIDAATGKIEVSDVRIKRYIRDYLSKKMKNDIFVDFDVICDKDLLSKLNKTKSNDGGKDTKNKLSGSAFSFKKHLLNKGLIDDINKDIKNINNIEDIFLEFIDVKLFGGLLTESGQNLSIQGALQFKNLNYSLHECESKILQNTTKFPSDVVKNEQGSFGTNDIIPYSLIQIQGWLDEITSKNNNLTEDEIQLALYCLWRSISEKNTRSKTGSTPLLLLEIVYQEVDCKFDNNIKVYNKIPHLDKLIKLETEKEERDIRSFEDYNLNFDKFFNAINKSNVKKVNFYTQTDTLINILSKNSKMKLMELIEII